MLQQSWGLCMCASTVLWDYSGKVRITFTLVLQYPNKALHFRRWTDGVLVAGVCCKRHQLNTPNWGHLFRHIRPFTCSVSHFLCGFDLQPEPWSLSWACRDSFCFFSSWQLVLIIGQVLRVTWNIGMPYRVLTDEAFWLFHKDWSLSDAWCENLTVLLRPDTVLAWVVSFSGSPFLLTLPRSHHILGIQCARWARCEESGVDWNAQTCSWTVKYLGLAWA